MQGLKIKEKCPTCGASMEPNEYSLNVTLLSAMRKILLHEGKAVGDMELDRAEYANLSKLKLWGFAYKTKDKSWQLTRFGKRFLRGELSAPKRVFYFRNKVVDSDGEVLVHQILPRGETQKDHEEFLKQNLDVDQIEMDL